MLKQCPNIILCSLLNNSIKCKPQGTTLPSTHINLNTKLLVEVIFKLTKYHHHNNNRLTWIHRSLLLKQLGGQRWQTIFNRCQYFRISWALSLQHSRRYLLKCFKIILFKTSIQANKSENSMHINFKICGVYITVGVKHESELCYIYYIYKHI